MGEGDVFLKSKGGKYDLLSREATVDESYFLTMINLGICIAKILITGLKGNLLVRCPE